MVKGFRIDRSDERIYTIRAITVSGEVHFPLASKGEACVIVFYRKGARGSKGRTKSPANARTGDVWSITILGDFSGLEYAYEVDGQQVPNPYGRRFTGMGCWGSPVRLDKPVRTPVDIKGSAYDWEKDVLPCIPYDQCVTYRTHLRGFTKHASSGVEGDNRGTFKDVAGRISYLEDLGITAVEMIPPVEFEELIVPERVDGGLFATKKPDGRLNYWGYTGGYYFVLKRAYSSGPVGRPEREFEGMAKALHKAGLKLALELFFDGKEAPSYILNVVRSWAQGCRVDGVRLMGYVPAKLLNEDPYLSRLKLLAPGWDGMEPRQVKHLAEYNDGFMVDMRSLLKGGEGQLNRLVYRIRHNPQQVGVINYMTSINGFTLMDTVSHDIRHDEANGEDNRGGTDCNQPWNCGVEGPSRKKRIMQIRRKQVRNALLMLFLNQGTFLLMMGDEFDRTRKGDSNSYCQDNSISRPNQSLLNSNGGIHELIKHVTRSREGHSVSHMERESALMDHRCVGLPNVPYHGLETWCPMFDCFLRQLDVLHCGKYGKKPDGGEDDYFYVALNVHQEPHELALPNLPKDFKWHIVFGTDGDRTNDMHPRGSKPVPEDQKSMTIMTRAIVALMGEGVASLKGAARGKAAGKGERREEKAHDAVKGNDTVYREPQAGSIRSSSGTDQSASTLQS